MALFSQWDWNRNSYKVFATRNAVSIGDDPEPPRPSNANILGAVPDSEAKRVPSGATFMGYSQTPRGEICRSESSSFGGGALGATDSGMSLVGVVSIGLLGLVGFWAFSEIKDKVRGRRS